MKFFTVKSLLFAIIIALSAMSVLGVSQTDVTMTTYAELRLWGEEQILPMTVTNTAPYPQEFRIEIDESVNRWGTYRIEPQQRFELLPGQTQELYLLLRADNNEFIGLQKFDMLLTSSNGDVRVIKMSTNILKPVQDKDHTWIVILFVFLGVIIIGILLIAIAVLFIRKFTGNKKEVDTFDDFEEFPMEEEQTKNEDYNEFDNFDDFDIFDDAESDKIIDEKDKSDEFY